MTPARKAETRTASKAKWVRRPSWEGFVRGGAGQAGQWGYLCTTMMNVVVVLVWTGIGQCFAIAV